MKEVPKKDEGAVSGGVTGTGTLGDWPEPTPYPIEPCTPTIADPLGDLKKVSGR